MNCKENNQIAFSDVGVFTHGNEISCSLTHVKAQQQIVAEAALESREGTACFVQARRSTWHAFSPGLHPP